MAVLKYKNANGEFVALTNYTVQPIEPVQTTGSSTSDIMSQNAVTSALSSKANSTDVYTKSETNTTFLTKSDASSTYLTQTSASNTYATIDNVTTVNNNITNIQSSITSINDSIAEIENELGIETSGSTSTDPIVRESDLENYALKTYVDTSISNLVNSAPETLNTLDELAAALGDDANFATTITTELGKKANSSDVYTSSQVDELLNGKSDTGHTHTISQISTLQTTLDNKSNLDHTHSYAGSSSVGGAATSANKVNSTLTWSGLSSGSFNGSSDSSFVIPSKVSELTNDSGFITTSTTVSTANKVSNSLNISGNSTSLGSFDGSSETNINITYSNIGAAAASHTHSISDVTELQTTLDAKANSTDVYTKTNADSTFATKTELSTETTNRTSAITSAINALDATVSGNGTYVDVTVTQTDGKITAVSVAESNIASASALSTETSNRTSADTAIKTAVGLNDSFVFVTPTTAETSGYTTAATTIREAIIIMDNQIEENETVAAYALSQLNRELVNHTSDTDVHIATTERSQWNDIYNFYEGVNTVTQISSIPVNKRLCIVTISTSGTLNLASTPSAGREIHIIVNNSSSSEITITMPSTSGYVQLSGDSLTVAASGYGEINIVSDGTNMYIRAI